MQVMLIEAPNRTPFSPHGNAARQQNAARVRDHTSEMKK
jgi:hypothetical protein